MHWKRSAKKVVLDLNKQTIANLNNWEMIKIGAGIDKTKLIRLHHAYSRMRTILETNRI